MFCGKCQNILNLDILLSTQAKHESHDGEEKPIPHHDNYSALVRSAEAGCTLCQLATRSLKRHELSGIFDSGEAPGIDERLYFALVNGDVLWFKSEMEQNRYSPFSDFTGIRLYASEVTRLMSDVFATRRLAGDSGSEQCFEMARHWMKTCMETHGPECSRKKAILPSRLIDVGRADHPTVSLHISNGEPGHWLTLSHCWGKKSMPGTTTSNIAARCNSIHLSSLPQTFRDAISITRKLGYRFIWIDCLCIIQDSLEDWQTESARMAEVYADADMNISADTTADAYEGIFQSSNKVPENPDLVAHSRHEEFLEIPVHGSLLPGATKLFAGCRELQYDPDVLSILGKRAWVFQEALLSRRRLRYTVQGLVWHCRTVYSPCTERNPHKIHDVDFDKDYVVSVYDIPYEPLAPRWAFGSTPRLGFQAIFWWYRQVNEYAPLLLTFSKDRFPALSGLAREFSARTGYQYRCGIWKEDFRRGLLWESTGGATDLTIAPSWSWAAAKCYANYKPIYACLNQEWNYLEGREAEVLESDVDFAQADVFGQAVLPVKLRLRGLQNSQ
ncbi:HET-domain-containing protein [Cadophora sp. DSE1049]|nr:HET-domain-containing protein [Cadophora sp. DSE1049]